MADKIKKRITCIICPVGCSLTATGIKGNLVIEGNECNRGEKYARSEYTNPLRTLTGTVLIKEAILPRLPVRSENPITRQLFLRAAAELNRLVVTAPIKRGAVISEDLAGSGIRLLATRDLDKL